MSKNTRSRYACFESMSQPQRARFVAAYKMGITLKELSQRFGRSPNTLRAILIEENVEVRDSGQSRQMAVCAP